MVSLEIFEAQPQAYKDEVLPRGQALKVAVEAGRGGLWYKYTGQDGLVLSLEHFGHSAPASILSKEYGFTVENLVKLIRERLALG